jgi:hypothetical protein
MILKGFLEFINESQSGATYADLKLLLELGIVDDIQDDMYRGFNQGSISYDELLDWVTQICDKYEIEGWTLNSKGSVDVDGWVNLDNKSLTRLPLRFGEISGDFMCSRNYLITLEGSPQEVGGDFSCSHNQLTSLEGAPKEVGESFHCFSNQLTSLEGIGEVKGKIYSDIK